MVYVDNYNAKYGRMIMCNMYADTLPELTKMMDSIGVNQKWIQHKGTWKEHVDVCLTKKQKAIKCGAQETGWRHYATFMQSRPDYHLNKEDK